MSVAELISRRSKGQTVEDQTSSLLTPAGSTTPGGLSRPVTAFIQRYARNIATAAEKDIRQIQYNLTTGTVDVSYHYHTHSVLDATHRFDHRHETSATTKAQNDGERGHTHDNHSSTTHSSSSNNNATTTTILSTLVPPVVNHHTGIRHLDDLQLLRSLAYNEKQLKHSIKEHEIQMNDLYQWCNTLHQHIELQIPIAYQDEVVLLQNDLLKGENGNKSSSGSNHTVSNDYLAASLLQHVPNYSTTTVLNRKQAIAVRDTCLTACKERMLNRASVIQQHVHQLETQLSNEKDRAAGMTSAASAPQQSNNTTTTNTSTTTTKPQSITKSIEELQFKLNVAQQRQKEHEEHSLRVYLALENELSRDNRLAVLYAK